MTSPFEQSPDRQAQKIIGLKDGLSDYNRECGMEKTIAMGKRKSDANDDKQRDDR
jgi:hypothetical protein